MDTQKLQVFVAVAEELHFGRRPRSNPWRQPHLSRTVRALETGASAPRCPGTTRRVVS
ncbi:hypothetical protein HBB16_10810 [Pseudonocardia sp. MCCB 268]|nr:hypothetical protein [Pseudonocardia cytotoxica]